MPEGGKDVKIVAVTASVFKEQREEMLAAGMDDFVRKPFRPAEILRLHGRQLGLRYVREDVVARPEESVPSLTPEALAALPDALRNELEDALIRLDSGKISELIGRIEEQDAELGKQLGQYADVYDYATLLRVLKASHVIACGSTA